jgi:hypothetical protein
MKNMQKIFTSWAVAVLLIFSAGCSSIAPQDSASEDIVPVKTIGVLPTYIASHLEKDSKNLATLETGAETINAIFANYFQNYENVNLISQTELEGLSYAGANRPFYLAREAGEKLHYDAILIPSISRYQERDGSEYAVITPASVAFSLKLLAVEQGRIVWGADFDQVQKPLLENILPKTRSTGSGFRWLTAAELTAAGINKKLESCPYLKRE